MDPQRILALVLDNDFYKLATKNCVINQLYTRNQFSVCKENLISINSIKKKHIAGGKGCTRVIPKQSAPQKSVVVEMLPFYVVHNVITVCHVAICRIIFVWQNNHNLN